MRQSSGRAPWRVASSRALSSVSVASSKRSSASSASARTSRQPRHAEHAVRIRRALDGEPRIGDLQRALRSPRRERELGAREPELPLAERERACVHWRARRAVGRTRRIVEQLLGAGEVASCASARSRAARRSSGSRRASRARARSRSPHRAARARAPARAGRGACWREGSGRRRSTAGARPAPPARAPRASWAARGRTRHATPVASPTQ